MQVYDNIQIYIIIDIKIYCIGVKYEELFSKPL